MGDREDDEVELDIAASFGAEADRRPRRSPFMSRTRIVTARRSETNVDGSWRPCTCSARSAAATAMPPVEGVGRMPGRVRLGEPRDRLQLHQGRPVLGLPELRSFLHRMGRRRGKVKSRSSSTGGSIAFATSTKPEVTAMANKIVATDSGQKRVRDIGPGSRRIDPAAVAEALGPRSGPRAGRGGGPVSSFQVRSELFHRLRSSGGGRPWPAPLGESRSPSRRASGGGSRSWRRPSRTWDSSPPPGRSRAS